MVGREIGESLAHGDAPMTDDLAGLVGQYVSVLLAVAGRTVTAKGLLVKATPTTITLRSVASRTRGRETLLMRQFVIAVQRVEQAVKQEAEPS